MKDALAGLTPSDFVVIVAALVAAVAAIGTTVVTALTSSSRARSGWLRDEQTRAYRAYSEAAWAVLDELMSGAVAVALTREGFKGLDDAYAHTRAPMSTLVAATRDVVLVGHRRAAQSCARTTAIIARHRALAIPASGVTNAAALQQRKAALGVMSEAVGSTTVAFREELGTIAWYRLPRVRLTARRRRALRDEVPQPTLDDAFTYLKRWHVRNIFGERIDDSRSHVLSQQTMLHFEKRVILLGADQHAVLVREPHAPWRAAIFGGLAPARIAAIEYDMALLVTHGGVGADAPLAGGDWVEGAVPGQKIFFWTREHGVPLQPSETSEPSSK